MSPLRGLGLNVTLYSACELFPIICVLNAHRTHGRLHVVEYVGVRMLDP